MEIAWSRPISVQLHDVHFKYGDTLALRGINMSVRSGEHIAIIGGNGSGKSTLIRTILGLLTPHHGTVMIDTVMNTPATQQHIFRSVAWMPQRQHTGQFPLLVTELWQSSGNPTRAQQFGELLEVAQLHNRPLHVLSGGQLQRVFLARALGSLAGGSGLLLADEPTAALDFTGQATVAELLATIPSTMIIITHDRAMMQQCSRIYEMAGGQLREVTP